MGNEVFANGNEIACKSGDDKVIAAFPDVCLSPPSPPAGPIPVPYPNTSFSKDMKKGSKSVKIDGKEVMLKDQSFYKTSPLGNEAATKSFGAGVISHVITGKTYFVAWSMDVKFEGKNVDRHLDLTTSNHASPMANEQLTFPGFESMIAPGTQGKLFCECCNQAVHSKAQEWSAKISENQFYGLEEFECPNGRKIPPLNDGQKRFVREAKAACPGIFPEDGDCKGYYIITDDEKKAIDKNYKDAKPDIRTKIGAAKGDQINHRTPRTAGGCPTGPGNCTKHSDLSPDCKKKDKTLSTYQSKRAVALKACLSS